MTIHCACQSRMRTEAIATLLVTALLTAPRGGAHALTVPPAFAGAAEAAGGFAQNLGNWGAQNWAALTGGLVNRDSRDTVRMGPSNGVMAATAGNGLKHYSGKRLANDSLRMVYFHDQTVAIVELGPGKLLLNCELVEVFEPEDAMNVLGEFKSAIRPVPISFLEMMKLMSQCQIVDTRVRLEAAVQARASSSTAAQERSIGRGTAMNGGSSRGLLSNNPLVLLSGIIPGTKWCGTGDIAADYHDLGAEPLVDRCCRAHDLCPVKVRAYSERYNLTNGSLYTKSHCACDDSLFTCLKEASESPTAHIMGNVYFNLIQVPCVQDKTNGNREFRAARNNF